LHLIDCQAQHLIAMSHTPGQPLSSKNLFFQPLPAQHAVPPGKEAHGRYMVTIPWSRVSGWGQAKISPRAHLDFDPLSGVLQYAVTCFEGMKVGLSGLLLLRMTR
jgi:branched-chain amino acid aminotransferase